MTPDGEAYLGALAAVLERRLRENLVGVYLHGSAVLGGWRQDRSDIDVLAVCAGEIGSDGRLEELAAALSIRVLRCPAARGLEFGLVTTASAAAPVAEPAFELDLSSGPSGDRATLGRRLGGHADYLMHFAVCRAHASRLHGPPPADVFGNVPAALLDRTFADELAWAVANAPPTYQVLNACRAWRYAAERVLCSKLAGGEWALRHGADAGLVGAALEHQRGGPEPQLDPAAVAALVARTTDELSAAAGYPDR